MHRATIQAAESVCVVQYPNTSHVVTRRKLTTIMNSLKVSQRHKENQWPAFLLPPSGAIQEAYPSVFWTKATSPLGPGLSWWHSPAAPSTSWLCELSPEPGRRYGMIGQVWDARVKGARGISHLEHKPYTVHLWLTAQIGFCFLIFFIFTKADLDYVRGIISQIYGQDRRGDCTDCYLPSAELQ